MFLRSPHLIACPLKSDATSSLFLVLIGVHPSKSANWMARLPSAYLFLCGSTISFYRHCLFAAGYSGSQSSEYVEWDVNLDVLFGLFSCSSGVGNSSVGIGPPLKGTNSALLVRSNSNSINCLLMFSCQSACSVNVSN